MDKHQEQLPQPQPYYYPVPPACEEEDEIDLRELFATIGKYKWKLFAFTATVVTLVLIYLLATPNSYTSKAVLAPQGQSKGVSLGGLGALASMAGISVGGAQVDAFTSLKTILEDYEFQKEVIEKYHLLDRWYDENLTKQYVFPFGFDTLYQLFHFKHEYKDHEKELYGLYKTLKKEVEITSDKKSGAITLSATHPNRFFAKELVTIYLDESVDRLRRHEMQDIDKKINYYERALEKADNVQLREQLSQLISSLIQKKVLAQSNRYYNVTPIIMPAVPNIYDKTKPKRGLILVVATITSLILGIFGIFFFEFLKSNSEEKEENFDNNMKI